MKCTTCEHTLTDDARFCTACGAPVSPAPSPAPAAATPQGTPSASAQPAAQPLTYDDLLRYQEACRAQQAFDQSIRDAQAHLRFATEQHDALHRTFTACMTIGIILLAMYVLLALPKFYAYDLALGIFMTIVPSPFLFALPFGFVPIVNWCGKHGFAIIATWVVILVLGIILIYVALFAGIPYFFHLRGKIKQAKQEVAAAQAYLQQHAGGMC